MVAAPYAVLSKATESLIRVSGLSSIVREKESSVKGFLLAKVHRRDLLGLAIGSTATAAAVTLAFEAVEAEPTGAPNKRKARYQANSAEVRDYYRVNAYPVR